jgi:hypothetical protein
MKFRFLLSIVATVSLFLLVGCNEVSKNKEITVEKTEVPNEIETRQLRHLVLFKFKDNVTADSIAIVERAFSALPSKIKEMRGFEWGTDNSPEGIAKGFTHSFLVTFHSEEDRAIYLPHPDHKNFSSIVGPLLEDVLVLDYWAGE